MKRQNLELSDWKLKAEKFLPASGFGNFDENIIIAKGKGSHVWDENGKKYIGSVLCPTCNCSRDNRCCSSTKNRLKKYIMWSISWVEENV